MELAAKQLFGHLQLVLICRAHLSVRHQKRLEPVPVVLSLADPIGHR
ncbi:hypothetical protein H8F27_15390 [Synechococcus sp. CBW1108]|nr:hypothetical protein H8F27_15390 [Synechococcus sp. CBW1108]